MLATQIIQQVSSDLFDQADGDTYARWSQADLLGFLNIAEKQIVFLKPSSYTVTGTYQLVSGTRQSLPDGTASFADPSLVTLAMAIELIRVIRNMGSDGLTEGDAITSINPKDLDECIPSWRAATANATVLHSVFEPTDRSNFDVYPPQPSGSSPGWVEVLYSAVPPGILISGDTNLGDEYAEATKEYMKYLAYDVDAANSQFSAQRAAQHLNSFMLLIGRKDMIEVKYKGKAYGNADQSVS